MAIIRINKDKENPYVMLNKTALNDDKLSWKAKGIFAYLMSKPDDWVCKVEDLKKHAKDGADSVKAGLRELREHGYMIKRPIRDNKNVIVEWEEALFETPQDEAKKIFEEQEARRKVSLEKRRNKATNGKSTSGNSSSGKPTFIINNEIPNTELPTNEISCSSESEFKQFLNLYAEYFGKITASRTNLLSNYFNKTNFEFIKAVLYYVIDQKARTHRYFNNTMDSLIDRGITTVEDFKKSLEDHHKKKSNYEKVNKAKDKKLRFNDFEQRNYDDNFYNELGESLNPANGYVDEEDEEDIIKSFLENKNQVEI